MSLSRRGVLNLCMAAAGAAHAPVVARAAQTDGPQPGDALVAVADDSATPLLAHAMERGAAPILAWPMDPATRRVRNTARFNQVLVLRVAGSGDGAPDPVVAFSAICPHAGCLVSGWIAETGRLHCPCHGSEYDPAKGGVVVAGPAPQPLPALPVQIVDDRVTIAGPFSTPPGGHASRTM
jgi:rieske iron-sulfur protein